MEVKYYGHQTPPHGLIEILGKLSFNQPVLFYLYEPFSGIEFPYTEIKSTQKNNLFVIITTHEGVSHHIFSDLIDKLVTLGVPYDHIILQSACLYDPSSPIKNVHTIISELGDFHNRYNLSQLPVSEITHHFVCLNRLHRWQRYRLIELLLDRGLDNFGAISYTDPPKERVKYSARLPLILDLQDVDRASSHSIDKDFIQGALFNIVTETGYEPHPSNISDRLGWHYPGMTEKTFKCIAAGQIPIFVTPFNTVNCYRKLGLDVFDDIIDHGYDQEKDPQIRLIKVVDEIERICDFSLDEVRLLKKSLHRRFIKNCQVLSQYAHNLDSELPQWQKILSNYLLVA
jgi:hypothetical protein